MFLYNLIFAFWLIENQNAYEGGKNARKFYKDILAKAVKWIAFFGPRFHRVDSQVTNQGRQLYKTFLVYNAGALVNHQS